MRTLKMVLEYDGADYFGWQNQKDRLTIQGTVEALLARILGEKIWVFGSGRTDAGVHALAQVAHFKTASSFPAEKIRKGLNSLLPQSIVIKELEETDPAFHAQFDAVRKCYHYYILNQRAASVFHRRYAWQILSPLYWEEICEALELLRGEHDFRSFQSTGTEVRSTVRHLFEAKLEKVEPGAQWPACSPNLYRICFEANGFLKQMVRNLVGTLVQIGKGFMPPGEILDLLEKKDRRLVGAPAPAKGLFLVRVDYPR